MRQIRVTYEMHNFQLIAKIELDGKSFNATMENIDGMELTDRERVILRVHAHVARVGYAPWQALDDQATSRVPWHENGHRPLIEDKVVQV